MQIVSFENMRQPAEQKCVATGIVTLSIAPLLQFATGLGVASGDGIANRIEREECGTLQVCVFDLLVANQCDQLLGKRHRNLFCGKLGTQRRAVLIEGGYRTR